MRKARKLPLLERLRLKKRLRVPPKVGVCWYTEDNWRRVKALALDPERFEASFGEWEAMVEDGLQDLMATGVNPEKVFVLSDELESWCQKHKKPNTAASRSEFVTLLMRGNGETFG